MCLYQQFGESLFLFHDNVTKPGSYRNVFLSWYRRTLLACTETVHQLWDELEPQL